MVCPCNKRPCECPYRDRPAHCGICAEEHCHSAGCDGQEGEDGENCGQLLAQPIPTSPIGRAANPESEP